MKTRADSEPRRCSEKRIALPLIADRCLYAELEITESDFVRSPEFHPRLNWIKKSFRASLTN